MKYCGYLSILLTSVVIIIGTIACSESSQSGCAAGASQDCTCPDGRASTRVCDDSGTFWGACDCRTSGDGDVDGDTDTDADNDADTDADNDADTDADNDTDTDADNDVDTDADNDTDTDADSDTVNDTGSEPEKCQKCSGLKGADILIVVDNSGSMEQEQQMMATSFFTLINTLVAPTEELKEEIDGEPAGDIRVALVSSDLGLQYGVNGETAQSVTMENCNLPTKSGDDGVFKTGTPESIEVSSGKIKCDEGGNQCPGPEWTCEGGVCMAPGGEPMGTVACPSLDAAGNPWAETEEENLNEAFVHNVSCMAQLGTDGCGFEQQLQAPIRALNQPNQNVFVRDESLLAVIVISDEEDCSIKDPGLFATPEWTGEDINIACNYPDENEENYLFDSQYFYDELVKIKNGEEYKLVFAAIVGVPTDDAANCQGFGDQLTGCLEHDKMKYERGQFTAVLPDGKEATFYHFEPACVRSDADGVEVTQARPGRRFVKLAERFGCSGYVYSICNADWSDAMNEIAKLIAGCIVVIL